jgi:hypothetical protein
VFIVQGGLNRLDFKADARVVAVRCADGGSCLLLQRMQVNGKLSCGCLLHESRYGDFYTWDRAHVYIDDCDVRSGLKCFIEVRYVFIGVS